MGLEDYDGFIRANLERCGGRREVKQDVADSSGYGDFSNPPIGQDPPTSFSFYSRISKSLGHIMNHAEGLWAISIQ
jgi:hypothetical protein